MRKTLIGLVTAGLMLTMTACGDAETIAVKANMGATIGIAMPTKTSTRWLADAKAMSEQFQSMGYKVDVQFGDDDVKKQVGQVRSMVAKDHKLLVIAAVDGSSMTEVLDDAAKKKIPVIAYDRLLLKTKNVSYQATFDNIRVGVMQGQLLVDRLGLSKGQSGPFTVELTAGSPTDANAKSFYVGAMRVLKPYLNSGDIVVKSGQTDFADITTERYDGTIAGKRIVNIVKQHYKTEKLDAVLSPYDGMSVGVIKALKTQGYRRGGSKPLPIISGQDAELPSMQSIIAGEQTATIYKDTRELAKVAVQQGNALLTGGTPMVNDTTTYDNEVKKVPTYLLFPVNVDRSNYKTLLVDGGYYTAADLKKKAA